MEKIEIQFFENNTERTWSGWFVKQGERYADGLSYDEMLGLVASITMPEQRPCLQWILTKEQHDARKKSYSLSNNNELPISK